MIQRKQENNIISKLINIVMLAKLNTNKQTINDSKLSQEFVIH